ncbi:FAD-dependent oxidoreductase [Acholeplasma granularum]|uniref:FAD-dependent oxidoreductase n=1 Tax=Acholeplasma granularum TaxID=264635 RepID=UPI0004726D21|nr:FAD-dependent oxidoreductase [Acholeplasma granularum]
MKKIIVIGGVAGGMSFATRYRRLNQNDEMIVFEKGPFVSFANCGLPYYISGEIDSKDKLLVAKDTMLINRFNLVIKQNHEVVKIDSDNKIVEVLNDGILHKFKYDKLIISTGAKPIIPQVKGLDKIPYFTLRNIPDLDYIMNFIETNNPKKVAIIGAGFIGLEVAENLKKLGLDVIIIEKASQVLTPLDYEMSQFAKDELEKNGISVYTSKELLEVKENRLILDDLELNVDFLISSIGVMPESNLALDAGIKLGYKNGIEVNDKFETSIEDIYAVGDAIVVKNYITNEDTLIPLASPANRQGRQLADILNGLEVTYKGTLGTSIVRIFDQTFATTGLNEKQLENRNYKVIHLLANDHAGYYPGATSINLKVIFDPHTEEILGAQAVGKKGVDKRIDIIATAIKSGLKVSDLQELELTYAPPFGSAKDIVNLAGYVSQNIILGHSKTYQWYDVERLKSEGALFVDLRSKEEVLALGKIPGSINIAIDELKSRINEIPLDKKIILYCQSGTRSYNAEQTLRPLGYNCYNLDGSYSIYSKVYKEVK